MEWKKGISATKIVKNIIALSYGVIKMTCCKQMEKHIDKGNFFQFKDDKMYIEDRYAIYEWGSDPGEENTSDFFMFCPFCGVKLQ